MRYPLRLWGLLLVISVAGCGNSLTGGGVPIGRAAIEGTVIDAEGAESPIYAADISLQVVTSTTSGANTYTAQTLSDNTGSFAFTNVPEGEATLQITPPRGMRGRINLFHVTLRSGDTASLAAAIEPEADDYAVTSLSVNPESIEATVGVPVILTATAIESHGQPVHPSWIVDGGIGRISNRGIFSPVRTGSGQLRVRAGDQERIIPVTVHL